QSACFFFSSRRRHTRSKRDWSSDVCSSDLKQDEVRETWYSRTDELKDALSARAEILMRDLELYRQERASSGELQKTIEEARQKKIGRASCRERVKNSVGAGALRKKEARCRC